MKFDAIRIAIIAFPAVIGLGLFGFAFAQRGHFVQDSEKRQQVEAQITSLLSNIETETAKPAGRLAAIPEETGEESTFLTFIRSTAQLLGVKIVRWAASPRGTAGQLLSQKVPNPDILDTTPLPGSIEIAGSYRSVIAFIRQLESADRLYNFSQIEWARPDQGFDVHFKAIITRYVTPPPAPPASAPAPSKQ